MSDTVHGASCSYANLSNYNSSSDGTLSSPAFRAGVSSGHYLVPQYGAVGYQTLTHDSVDPTCNGYFNIQNAYGADADNCNTQFASSDCAGNVIDDGEQQKLRMKRRQQRQFRSEPGLVDPNKARPVQCVDPVATRKDANGHISEARCPAGNPIYMIGQNKCCILPQ